MTRRTPAGTVVYAIGDIHGRSDLLALIQERIALDAYRRTAGRRIVVYLGDYVSRGVDSRRVVDLVRKWQPEGFASIALKGNHEDMLLRYLGGDLDAGRYWFEYDGLDALAHYNIAIPDRLRRDDAAVADLRERFTAALPREHLCFFTSLQTSYQAGDYCFVHGGVRPGISLADQNAHDCMWIREPFLSSEADHGAVIVHGHTICEEPEVRHNRIGIDTGAYHSGRLTCLVLDGAGREFLQT
jgi:serine/threonine protein phosphatase 1